MEQNRLDKRHVLLDHTASSSPSVTLNSVNTSSVKAWGTFPFLHVKLSQSRNPSMIISALIDIRTKERT
jgi:hypothetical protein